MSSNIQIRGTVHKYGDDVDTDVIIPARYLNSADGDELAKHCLEDLDATFAQRVKPGDILVAGDNFGCGSSREHAPLAIKHAGVSCVVANTFARIFFRNAINIGLPVCVCPEAVAAAESGDDLEVDIVTGVVINHTKGTRHQAAPYPETMRQLITAGGLVNYVRARVGAG